MPAKIGQKDLETWADFLLNHSLGGVDTDDVIMVKGEPITWPLMSVLQNKIFAAGAIADINLVAPDNNRGQVWGAAIARHGTVQQIERVPAWHRTRYESMNKYIEILGAENPGLFADLPLDTATALSRADEPFKTIRLEKSWVLTLYPTEAFAAIESMDLQTYTDIIVKASTAAPRLLEKLEDPVFKMMESGRTIVIRTRHPHFNRILELTMDIGDRFAVKCTGKRNFPDGEVFTSPNAGSVQGEIFVDLPVFYSGVTLQGIYLKFVDGMIVDYRADREHETLKKIIETDEGSHRLGEIALGMNQGLTVALRHPLFVEKVSGTLHIAIGASYPECFVRKPQSVEAKPELEAFWKNGAFNKSAQHVDIVVDYRRGGAGRSLFVDDTEIRVIDNVWTVMETGSR